MTAQCENSEQKDISQSTHHLTLNWTGWSGGGLPLSTPLGREQRKKKKNGERGGLGALRAMCQNCMTEERKNKVRSGWTQSAPFKWTPAERDGRWRHCCEILQDATVTSDFLPAARQPALHISTRQRTSGMMWNVSIAG